MTRSEPPVVIFLHVPKTAGLTLRNLLRRQYRDSEIFVPKVDDRLATRADYLRWLQTGEHPPTPVPGGRNRIYEEQLAALGPERLARLRLMVGHFWFGLHESLPGSATYVTMLRRPAERVLSLYHHRVTRHGLAMSLEEYVRLGRDLHMDNDQTRRLSAVTGSDNLFPPATPEMLDRARANLDAHVAVAGLTERFDESVILMRERFGWRRATYVSWNRSSGRPTAAEIDPATLREIHRRNELDQELYEHAAARFDETLRAAVPDPERALAAFRRRNARYQRVAPAVLRVRRAAAAGLRRAPSVEGNPSR